MSIQLSYYWLQCCMNILHVERMYIWSHSLFHTHKCFIKSDKRAFVLPTDSNVFEWATRMSWEKRERQKEMVERVNIIDTLKFFVRRWSWMIHRKNYLAHTRHNNKSMKLTWQMEIIDKWFYPMKLWIIILQQLIFISTMKIL